MKFSVIVPVFNRPDEVEELLDSLKKQTFGDFEVVIVEDGSQIDCKKEVEKYSDSLKIKYFFKENEKPAIARNYGVERAEGEFVVFVDSDCIIPADYFEKVITYLKNEDVEVYGGPDAADPDFSNMQKAISYSMTAFFTTGNIRGGEKVDKFYPRSFNLGVKKSVFDEMGGFPVTKMHPGEDMVFAIELIKRGYKTKLFKNAFVYHKRRNTLKSFFKQVFKFGKTRFIISKVYPDTFKVFYLAPTVFVLGVLGLIGLSFIWWFAFTPIVLYILLLFFDSLFKNKKLSVAFLSIITSFYQLFGYGLGFLQPIFKGDEFGVMKKGFYS
ncbi:MAG: glycosyltransferase [Bacteroidales bacterium]|nr:glycosyltransferase [Bacteroidales bacterium]